jgi:ABC-type sugar transport system ATPase subunit
MSISSSKLLEMKNITKVFPGVTALDDVNFNLKGGEVHALIGENGAGKSTLIKILSGIYQPTEGSIYLNNEEIGIRNPVTAQAYGISVIYQEINFVPNLTVAENIFLGHKLPLKYRHKINWRELNERSYAILKMINGTNIDPTAMIKKLSPASVQMVMIAHAISQKANIIIMDEPTSSLTSSEIDMLFEVINRLKENGVAFIYISHRLEETFSISDRITVLRNGKIVTEMNTKDADKDSLIQAMIGKSINEKYTTRKHIISNNKILEVKKLHGGPLKDISFSVMEGEIFGIIGLLGSGRTELARILFGIDPIDEGDIIFNGKKLENISVPMMIQTGISLIPEERKSQGLILAYDIETNITYPALKRYRKGLFGKLDSKKIKDDSEKMKDTLNIKATSVSQKTEYLSGGNQQKVVIAKWLNINTRLLILDEPTKGIDVGAKTELYLLLKDLVAEGKGIIFISSEIPEILGVCDRVLILHEGKSMGIADIHDLNEHKILHKMFGEKEYEK